MGDYKMVTEVNVNKCTINDLFVQYVEDRLYVNRKYQRKLVWNIYDKKLLIDSIIRGVPLPTLLLSEYKENGKTYRDSGWNAAYRGNYFISTWGFSC